MHHELKGGCVYLAELDVHFPELTLGETLTFAASTRTTGSSEAATGTPSNVGRTTAALFNLDEAFNTKVGDAMIRGLSGGEKKRASLAEAFISGAQIQCWDNSTRGLDSSTAIRCIELLRRRTESLQSTVIMSIYQASEAMYEVRGQRLSSTAKTLTILQKFDKVTLLYEGRQIYFGPADLAEDYFYRLGFARPSRTTTADFLTSLTNPAERVVREGYEDRAPRSPDEFARIWKQGVELTTLRDEITNFNSAYPTGAQAVHMDDRKARYALTYLYT